MLTLCHKQSLKLRDKRYWTIILWWRPLMHFTPWWRSPTERKSNTWDWRDKTFNLPNFNPGDYVLVCLEKVVSPQAWSPENKKILERLCVSSRGTTQWWLTRRPWNTFKVLFWLLLDSTAIFLQFYFLRNRHDCVPYFAPDWRRRKDGACPIERA